MSENLVLESKICMLIKAEMIWLKIHETLEYLEILLQFKITVFYLKMF